jgi:oligosaccharyltransferase complex subunit gamma
VHSWVARHLPDRPHPPIKRPINWMRWISTLTILSGGLTVSFVAWPYVLPVIQSRTVWAAITLISILLFTSGHMFNHIRNVPYVAGDGKGGISYFASGFQNQYGLETQIVAAMCKCCFALPLAKTIRTTTKVYPFPLASPPPILLSPRLYPLSRLSNAANQKITDGILALSSISLAIKVPRMSDPRAQGIAFAAWFGVLFVVYSLLLSIFRGKNPGYTFSLPPFM